MFKVEDLERMCMEHDKKRKLEAKDTKEHERNIYKKVVTLDGNKVLIKREIQMRTGTPY